MDTYNFSDRKRKIALDVEFPSITHGCKTEAPVLDYSWLKDCVYTEIKSAKPVKQRVNLPKPPKMILFKTKDQYDWSSVPCYFFPSY